MGGGTSLEELANGGWSAACRKKIPPPERKAWKSASPAYISAAREARARNGLTYCMGGPFNRHLGFRNLGRPLRLPGVLGGPLPKRGLFGDSFGSAGISLENEVKKRYILLNMSQQTFSKGKLFQLLHSWGFSYLPKGLSYPVFQRRPIKKSCSFFGDQT